MKLENTFIGYSYFSSERVNMIINLGSHTHKIEELKLHISHVILWEFKNKK